ncbi:exodeoxyribonuclease VII large subunit [Pseudochelatococcus sp. G4_1912]|uniref:exodeoxyribonuclease VII large subunit n=1 Tax=Pseudochelatococcus sp. G4_1912 TaxID=3114288 RepID=UPI0039C6510F
MSRKPVSTDIASTQSPATNTPEWSVTTLAGALKRTLEDAFGHVRLRGEITGYRGPHSSGHAYFGIKDEGARIDAVIWKGVFQKLKIRPEEGMEVIAIGRITTFPGSSKYQIVVESIEPAGVGALMAILEERRKKLAAEGLFDETKKRPLPFLPEVIGVVTSPTGAVIRDILHRLADRFPRRVLVWPVRVQGETSAAEVAAAVRGFNALPINGDVPRPDVLIVARGGGSLEDLWSFNEEIVVRAVAESAIPVVAAIGHETDWTLIDLAADMRAPTPTAAAEKVVPVQLDLLATTADLARRHRGAMHRLHDRRVSDLKGLARALPSAESLLATPRQRLDLAGSRLLHGLGAGVRRNEARLSMASQKLARLSPLVLLERARARWTIAARGLTRGYAHGLERREAILARAASRLTVQPIRLRINDRSERVKTAGIRLVNAFEARASTDRARLDNLWKLVEGLSHKGVLARGYAIILDEAGQPIRTRAGVSEGMAIDVVFADGAVRAIADGDAAPASGPRPAKKRKAPSEATPALTQPNLFDVGS